MVIQYTVANERVATGKTVRECLNWKKANEKEYNKAFRAALNERKGKLTRITHWAQPTTEELDEVACAIQEAHHKAMRKTVPTAKLCQHSVPYWDEEMSILHEERMQVKETC